MPKKLVKTGSSGHHEANRKSSGQESASATTEAGTTLTGGTTTIGSTNLRKTSGSDGTGSHNAFTATMSSNNTQKLHKGHSGGSILPVKSQGSNIPSSKVNQKTIQAKKFSMSHGGYSASTKTSQ